MALLDPDDLIEDVDLHEEPELPLPLLGNDELIDGIEEPVVDEEGGHLPLFVEGDDIDQPLLLW